MRDPERILIVRLSHLGDVVHALGVFHALHEAFPAARIGWAIQPEFAGLLLGLDGLDRIVTFDRNGGLGAWRALRRELAHFAPELVVDAQGNTKSAAVALLAGAPRRVAPARADWREPWAAFSANDRARAVPSSPAHAMQRMEALVRHVLPLARMPLRTDPGLTDEERRRGAAALEQRLPRAGAPVLLHLSSPKDVRSWPPERWSELVGVLSQRGQGVLVISGPGEELLARELARSLPQDPSVAHWVAQRGLRELAAVFTAAGARGLQLVACDSGPMHLAAACGLGVIALEGPQDAARTGPWPRGEESRHRVVTTAHPPACAPCLKRRCRHPSGPVCMSGITAEAVVAAIAPALNRRSSIG